MMRDGRTSGRWTAPLTIAAAAAAAMLGAAPAAHGQGPVALGIGGGVTMPRDQLEGANERGYHGQLTLRVGVPLVPVHARVDAMHGRLAGAPAAEGDFEVSALGASLGYDVVPLAVASLYVVGGAGYYWTKWDAADAERVRSGGWNAGVGLRLSLGAAQLFGEARYHTVRRDEGVVHFIPLTVGLIF